VDIRFLPALLGGRGVTFVKDGAFVFDGTNRIVTPEEKNRLLKNYGEIPERQVETSVVLGDERWFNCRQPFVRRRDAPSAMSSGS
jgi:hypothetical protein